MGGQFGWNLRFYDFLGVSGFICEPYGIDGAEEITHLSGWKPYIAQQ